MKDPNLTSAQYQQTVDQSGDGCGYYVNGHPVPVGPVVKVAYASTLEKGDHCYLWNGDVRRGAEVQAVSKSTIVLIHWGEFSRRTGKRASQSDGFYIGNAAGERIVDAVPSVAAYAKEGPNV